MRLALMTAIVAFATPARAQNIEYVGTAVAHTSPASLYRVGDARYLTLTELLYDGATARVDVLDLTSQAVAHVEVARATLANKFGRFDAALNRTQPPDGVLAVYEPTRAGLYLSDDLIQPTRRHWYVEVDGHGTITRTATLGATSSDTEVHLIGTDLAHDAVWFTFERFGGPWDKSFKRAAGPSEIAFRRLDLKTLKLADVVSVALPARKMKSGYEDQVMVHAADDFSRFAVVEYDEPEFHTSPAASVFFVDPDRATSFSVPAVDTTYGVAFAHDGKNAYLVGAGSGTVARVDLAKQAIDKRVKGPKLIHHAVVSADDSRLYVLGSSKSYVVFDLPTLRAREYTHAKQVAPAAAELFGGGVISLDDRYFVLQQALPPGPSIAYSPTQEFVIARLGN